MCGAVFALRLSPCERRGLAAFAVVAGAVAIVSSIGLTAWLIDIVAGDTTDVLYEPAWLWGLVASALALACSALGVRIARRGWRGARYGEPGLRYGRGPWATWALWIVWSASVTPWLTIFGVYVMPFVLGALLALFVAGRVVAARGQS